MFQIAEVTTEYQHNPVGLDCARPRFRWRYAAGSRIVQKSCRVLVASDPALLAVGTADLYDSGTVQTAAMSLCYAGRTLASRQVAYVRVLAESTAGERTESEVNFFEMGLLAPADWRGHWMSIPVNFAGGTLFFRKNLHLPKKEIRRARAYVAGIGYHECYCNGRKVTDSVLNPGVTDYNKRVLYCVYDLAPFFQGTGEEVFGVEVGYGWFGGRKLLVQIYVEYADGTLVEDHSDCAYGWWVSGTPVIENSIYGGEVYDARREVLCPGGWCTAAFEPSWSNGWMYTLRTQAPQGRLDPQLMEPIAVCGRFPAISRSKLADGSEVFDVGQNLAGWARIRVRGARGARVTLLFAEDLKADGSVNRLNLRSARCADTYILKGEGTEEYAPRFTYHGFRYVQAEFEGRVELLELCAEHVHTRTEPAGRFSCSDPILNRLHDNAVITEQNNQHSIMTDCPQRDERFGWLNDLSARLFQTSYNFRMERFYPKFVRDITHSQDERGAIADTVPYYTGGQPADPVCVSYLLFGLFSYQLYGDRRVVEEEYEGFRAWVEYLLTRQQDFVMDYYYYADWVPPAVFEDSQTDGIFISTLFLYWHLKAMARLAEIVGRREDVERYRQLAERSQASIVRRYYHVDQKSFAGGTQAENAIPLWLGLVPVADRAAVARNVAEDMRRRGDHCTCGNQGYRCLFYALSDEGYIDDLVRMIENPKYPGWGYMIAGGATTVWERWEKEMQNEMHSFDHPMFGSYDAWLYRYIGGIRIGSGAEAADRIVIAPVLPTTLSSADCAFDTVRGKIACRWERLPEGNVRYDITIPANTSATVVLAGAVQSVCCDAVAWKVVAEAAAGASGESGTDVPVCYDAEKGKSTFRLESGTYTIITAQER